MENKTSEPTLQGFSSRNRNLTQRVRVKTLKVERIDWNAGNAFFNLQEKKSDVIKVNEA